MRIKKDGDRKSKNIWVLRQVEMGYGLTFRSAEAAASGSETSIICLPGM